MLGAGWGLRRAAIITERAGALNELRKEAGKPASFLLAVQIMAGGINRADFAATRVVKTQPVHCEEPLQKAR